MKHTRALRTNLCRLALLGLPLLLTCPEQAQAQISVDAIIVDFAADGTPVRNIEVRNSSDAALLVETSVVEVHHAGLPHEERLPTDSLLASPKRFSVGPKSTRTVRLLLRDGTPEQERVFRASFVPKASETYSGRPVEKGGISLRLLTGIGILVFAHPKEENPQLTIKEHSRGVTLANEGNVNILIQGPVVCPFTQAEENDCRALPSRRLYPGNLISFDLGPRERLQFNKKVGDSYTEIRIPE